MNIGKVFNRNSCLIGDFLQGLIECFTLEALIKRHINLEHCCDRQVAGLDLCRLSLICEMNGVEFIEWGHVSKLLGVFFDYPGDFENLFTTILTQSPAKFSNEVHYKMETITTTFFAEHHEHLDAGSENVCLKRQKTEAFKITHVSAKHLMQIVNFVPEFCESSTSQHSYATDLKHRLRDIMFVTRDVVDAISRSPGVRFLKLDSYEPIFILRLIEAPKRGGAVYLHIDFLSSQFPWENLLQLASEEFPSWRRKLNEAFGRTKCILPFMRSGFARNTFILPSGSCRHDWMFFSSIQEGMRTVHQGVLGTIRTEIKIVPLHLHRKLGAWCRTVDTTQGPVGSFVITVEVKTDWTFKHLYDLIDAHHDIQSRYLALDWIEDLIPQHTLPKRYTQTWYLDRSEDDDMIPRERRLQDWSEHSPTPRFIGYVIPKKIVEEYLDPLL